jgi:hypothetical protein
MEAWDRRDPERTWRIIEAVERIADGRGLRLTEAETAVLDDASDLAAVDYPDGELGLSQRARDLGGS